MSPVGRVGTGWRTVCTERGIDTAVMFCRAEMVLDLGCARVFH